MKEPWEMTYAQLQKYADQSNISNVPDYELFKQKLEEKYGQPIIDHHMENGFTILDLENGDAIRIDETKKLVGNPFAKHAPGKIGSHFTKPKYSFFGYRKSGQQGFEFGDTIQNGKGYHFREVQQALSEGKPVPPEVLRDYANLVQSVEPIPEMDTGMVELSESEQESPKFKFNVVHTSHRPKSQGALGAFK